MWVLFSFCVRGMVFEEIITVLAAVLIVTRFPGLFWPAQTRLWIEKHLGRAKHEAMIVLGLIILVLGIWMSFLVVPQLGWVPMFSAWITIVALILGVILILIPDVFR